MSDQGIECPNCGGDDIVGTVTGYYMKVPLARDGFCPTDGKVTGYDVSEAQCRGCHARLNIVDFEEGKAEAALKVYGLTLTYEIGLTVAAKTPEDAVCLSQAAPKIMGIQHENQMALADHKAEELGEWWGAEGLIEIWEADP